MTIQWGGTGWEMSGGLLFSALPARAFANAPVIVGGVPQTVEGGGVKTLLVETQTRPMLVPFVFAHYRYGEWAWNGQRIALLSTFGVGVNTYSASADFAATPLSFAFRGLIVSPVLHFVRDLRLTNGLYPGLELGSSPPAPSTERHWVRKLAVGVSYVIPD